MQWLRLYTEVLDDPKVQRLPDGLFKTWVNLLCLARRHDGRLPADIEDMAFALRLSCEEMQQRFAALQAAGLFEDEDREGGARPHNWNGRQFKSDHDGAERVRRYRRRKRGDAGNVTGDAAGDVTGEGGVTAPEQSRTDSDSESDSEPESDAARAGAETDGKGGGGRGPGRRAAGGKDRPLPEGFSPSSGALAYCREKLGRDPRLVTRILHRLRCLSAEGERRADWNRAFRWQVDRLAEEQPLRPVGRALSGVFRAGPDPP